MKLLIIIFLLPLQSLAQDITGIWSGYMQTAGSHLPFEIVVSETGSKFSGYSLTIFTIEGVENTGVKSIKLKKKNTDIIIEDDELIYNNYSTPPRRVKLFCTLSVKAGEPVMTLSGSFQTKSLDHRAQDNNSYSGTIILQKQNDHARTKLIRKLDEMNLLNALSFIQSETVITDKTAVANAPTEEPVSAPSSEKKIILNPALQKDSATMLSSKQKGQGSILPAAGATIVAAPAEENEMYTSKEKAIALNPSIIKDASVVAGSKTKETGVATSSSISKKTIEIVVPDRAAAEVNTRKTEVIRSIFFKSDSLTLTLYDNGIVDGDTVSVVLNGKVIMPKQGLSEKAIKLVFHVTPDLGDSLQLIMYAENLGSIPPNTGLLIVEDGDNRYEIRFEGDMQKSSAVILRRKR